LCVRVLGDKEANGQTDNQMDSIVTSGVLL